MAERLLITGAPGWLADAFIGSIAAGNGSHRAVRCLVERGATVAGRLPDWVEVVEGDLRDADAMKRAVAGVDAVLHGAGILHVHRTRDWYDINTRGTRILAQAALDSGVRRFVFLSSNAAAGRAPNSKTLLDEAAGASPISHYGKSKYLAEQALLALAHRFEPVIIRPCMFYGPPVPRRHVEIYRRILDGRMPLVGGGGFRRSVTHIDNLVQGCHLALTNARAPGQTYYIADGRDYTTREVVEAMASALGVEPRFLPLPRMIAPVALMADLALASVGRYWQTLHLVGEADWHVGVSIDKARHELGYQPTMELAEGMRQAVEWCRAQGYLG